VDKTRAPSTHAKALSAMVFFYLVVVLVVAGAVLIAVWPAASGPLIQTRLSRLSDELRYVLLIASAATLGSSIHTLTSFVDYVGNRQLQTSWLLWYVYRVLVAIPLALIVYFVLRGGLLSTQASVTDLNLFGFAAVAGLVGMFSKPATDKLNEVFSSLFGKQTHLEDEIGRISETLGVTWLANYHGYLCLAFQDEEGKMLPPSADNKTKLLAKKKYQLLAWFQPDPPKTGDYQEITVRGGIDSADIEFHLTADSEKVSLRPRSVLVPFGVVGRSKDAKFEFDAPDDTQSFDLWLEVVQKNRFIDIVSSKILVEGATVPVSESADSDDAPSAQETFLKWGELETAIDEGELFEAATGEGELFETATDEVELKESEANEE
jgi:hypothetical protein